MLINVRKAPEPSAKDGGGGVGGFDSGLERCKAIRNAQASACHQPFHRKDSGKSRRLRTQKQELKKQTTSQRDTQTSARERFVQSCQVLMAQQHLPKNVQASLTVELCPTCSWRLCFEEK